jgi:hypothetical protein
MKQLIAALVISAGAILAGQTPERAQAAPSKPASFNGTWSVRLVTEAGSCDPSYLYTVAVQDGQVRPAAANGGASVSGGVGADGSVSLGVQKSIARGEGSGRLQGASGSGTWRLPLLGCTGRWSASRTTV